MPRFYVPACGDRIVLEKDWEFDLYLESRNVDFAIERGFVTPAAVSQWVARYEGRRLRHVRATLPEGTVLECDRVYVRSTSKSRTKDEDDHDSITWKVVGKNGKAVARHRFWAKLASCSDIEFRQEADGLYRDRVKAVKSVMKS